MKIYHKWTDEEIDFLTKNYPIHGSKVIMGKYPHLSIRMIQCKAKQLSLQNKWSVKELITLRMNYGKIPLVELQKLLPKRSKSSIRHKANFEKLCTEQGKKKFGKKQHRWTPEEIDALYNVYPSQNSRGVINLFPHLTIPAIEQKAHSLGIRAHLPNWTAEEKNVILQHYYKGYREVMKLLPNRSKSAIITVAGRLGCTNYGKANRKSYSCKYMPSPSMIERRKMEIRQQNRAGNYDDTED